MLCNDGSCTTDATGTSGSDQTDLATVGCIPTNGGRFTDMLMVTTTMRMFHGLLGGNDEDGKSPLLQLFDGGPEKTNAINI